MTPDQRMRCVECTLREGGGTNLDLLFLVLVHAHRGAIFILEALATRGQILDIIHE